MRNRKPGEATAGAYVLSRPWPPDDTEGFITFNGRKFHSSEACSYYQLAMDRLADKGGTPEPLEWVTAAEARHLERVPCAACWR